MTIEVVHQIANSDTNRIDFSVQVGGNTHHFGISEESLAELEKTVFRSDTQWMRAFNKHKPMIRQAVEAHLQGGQATAGISLVKLAQV